MRSLKTFKSSLITGLAVVSLMAIEAQAYWGPQDRDSSWECRDYHDRELYNRSEEPRARRMKNQNHYQRIRQHMQEQNRDDEREKTSFEESTFPERQPIFTRPANTTDTISVNKPAMANSDIFQFIVSQPGLTRFGRALQASGLLDDLQGGTYTIFAPVDSAFTNATAFEFEELLKPENQNRLRDLVAYHITQGQALSNTPLREARSINGKKLVLRSQSTDKKMTVNGVEVMDTDLIGSNGVIHIIGKVLVP